MAAPWEKYSKGPWSKYAGKEPSIFEARGEDILPTPVGMTELYGPASEALTGLLDVGTLMGTGGAMAARQYAKEPIKPLVDVAKGAIGLPMMAGRAAMGDVAAQEQLRSLPMNIAQSYTQAYGSPKAAYMTAATEPGRFATDIMAAPSMASLAAAPFRGAVSAVGGAATPVIRNVLNPKARLYEQAFGTEMPQAINALATARPELTSTQAIADVNAPLAQAVAQELTPQVPQQTRAAMQAQEASRAQRIGQIAGTPEDLAAAQEARSAEAKVNYGHAFKQIMQETPELTDIMNRPSMEKAFGRAAKIAEERAVPFQIGKTTPETISESKILDEFGRPVQKVTPAEIAKYPVRSLHYVKMALDDMIRDPESFGIGATEVAAVRDTRKEFVRELEKNEAYAKARADYASQSVPISKMQVAQELKKSLTSPTTGETTRGAMFARAVEEAPKTIKRSTGQPYYGKLEDIFDPEEMQIVNDVKDEFRRTQLAKDQARLAESSAKDLASQPVQPITGIKWLNSVWTIANTIVRRSLGKIDQKLAVEIGLETLDKDKMRKALEAAQKYNAQTKRMQQGLAVQPDLGPAKLIAGSVTARNAMTPENRNAMAR